MNFFASRHHSYSRASARAKRAQAEPHWFMRTNQISGKPLKPETFCLSDRPYVRAHKFQAWARACRVTSLVLVPRYVLYQYLHLQKTRTRERTRARTRHLILPRLLPKVFCLPVFLLKNSLYVSFRPKRSDWVERSKPLWADWTWNEKWAGANLRGNYICPLLVDISLGESNVKIIGVSWKIQSSTDITGLTLKMETWLEDVLVEARNTRTLNMLWWVLKLF